MADTVFLANQNTPLFVGDPEADTSPNVKVVLTPGNTRAAAEESIKDRVYEWHVETGRKIVENPLPKPRYKNVQATIITAYANDNGGSTQLLNLANPEDVLTLTKLFQDMLNNVALLESFTVEVYDPK